MAAKPRPQVTQPAAGAAKPRPAAVQVTQPAAGAAKPRPAAVQVTQPAAGAAKPRPTVGVLALQGDVAEHIRALAAAGAEPAAVRRPEELDRADGLVIPGGESTTIWKLIDIFGLADQLRKRIADGMPVFGSCAGMIMLADRLPDPASGQETLGGIDMTVRRNAFGRQVDSFERDLDIDGLAGGPYRAVFIRAPWVEEVGPGVEILATDPGTSRIVAVRQGRALATSFHPELTPDWRIHEMFVDMVRDRA
jgi:5'-phosphate synthase pdxT subunit